MLASGINNFEVTSDYEINNDDYGDEVVRPDEKDTSVFQLPEKHDHHHEEA